MAAHVLNTVLGIWLIAAPSVLGYADPARTNDHIFGPIAASLACIAVWEATRPLRWGNLLIGAWLLVAPFVLGYEQTALVHSLLVGAAMAGLALVRGRQRHRFDGGWSSLWRNPALARR
jgi:hypothetical protein